MSDIDLKALRERFCCLTRAIRDTGVARKAFEAWAIERKLDVTPDNQCGYESEMTLGAWHAWGVTPSEDIRLAISLLDRLESLESSTASIASSSLALVQRAETAERERDALLKAAKSVLSWVDCADRPPVHDLFEIGRAAGVRVHALADLQLAVDAIGAETRGAQ